MPRTVEQPTGMPQSPPDSHGADNDERPSPPK
jgi:hypothetical protein